MRNLGWTAGLLLLYFCVAVHGETIKDDAALRAKLTEIAASHHGKVALYAVNLKTHQAVALHADEEVQTASVIKLAILFEAMEQVRSGKVHWDEKITMPAGYGVGGSGVLAFFDAPLILTLKDVLTMMIVVSDNTATDLAIDRLGIDNINARIAWMGLEHTHLYKRIGKPATGRMPADQPKFGLGKTTPREMARLMQHILQCDLALPTETVTVTDIARDKAICDVGTKMLRKQFYRDTIPRYVEKLDSSETGSGIASKTGSLDAVRADVAIVAGKSGPMVLSIFTYENADRSWTSDNEGEVTIAKLARAIVETWSPEGIDGKTLDWN
ncbi:MAG TPA: serine hydrolase [Acidobacteriaceae bacterium]